MVVRFFCFVLLAAAVLGPILRLGDKRQERRVGTYNICIFQVFRKTMLDAYGQPELFEPLHQVSVAAHRIRIFDSFQSKRLCFCEDNVCQIDS